MSLCPFSHFVKRIICRLKREHFFEGLSLPVHAQSLFIATRIIVCLCMRCRVNTFNCHPDNNTGNLVTEPLSSNGRLLWFQRHATLYCDVVVNRDDLNDSAFFNLWKQLIFRTDVPMWRKRAACKVHVNAMYSGCKFIQIFCGFTTSRSPQLVALGAMTNIALKEQKSVYSVEQVYCSAKGTIFHIRYFTSAYFSPLRDEVARDWRKLHNEQLHNLYSSPCKIRMIKSRIMRWAGHVARIRKRGMHIGFWWKSRT
jgi:hypothetical protein